MMCYFSYRALSYMKYTVLVFMFALVSAVSVQCYLSIRCCADG
jgi:hypothetical protein